jgi:hypothetical protein
MQGPPWIGALVALASALWEAFLSGDGLTQYWSLPALVFLLGIGQVIAALLGRVNALSKQLDDRNLRRKIASRLGDFLQESKRMYDDHRTKPDGTALTKWSESVEAYLDSEPHLGRSYVARFQNGAGIHIEIPAELKTDKMSDRRQIWCKLHTRRARLTEFIQELERR